MYTCHYGNRNYTNCGTYLNKHNTHSNQNERILDAYVIGGYLPKTYITSLFVLFIKAVFVKLKINLHFFAMGQANIRGVIRNSFRKIYKHLY